MNKKIFRVLSVGALVLAFLGPLAASASAAPPPPGYPTQQIMTTANNPALGSIPIRRGFYDAAVNQGFGFDKAWNYHNIWSGEAMRRVMLSTNYTKQGNGNYALKAYAGKYVCQGNRCQRTDQRELIGVHNGRSYDKYFNQRVGGLMGMQTMYCNQGGVVRCPSWVTYSITNPGVNNPYSAPAAESSNGVESLPPSSPEKSALEREKAQEPEIKQLFSEIAAGITELSFSYTPLPLEIANPNSP